MYKNELTYTRVGDYYVPNLSLPKQEKITLNKYGRMRLNFLKEHKKSLYTKLILNGKLNTHLKEFQETAEREINLIINKLKDKNNITEEMKNSNQLYWVGMMNNFKNQAEEIVCSELIYN